MKRTAQGILFIGFIFMVGIGAIFNPGAQPGQGVQLLLPSNCDCHGGSGFTQMQDWQGSMMAQAQRDLTYFAQLDISNFDVPGSGEYCIRCHTPKGWLEGRSEPTDMSALVDSDREGVTCHYCHSMVDPLSAEADALGYPKVYTYGNGQHVPAGPGDYARRIPGGVADCPHPLKDSSFHSSGDLCGTCHDVSNPLMKNPWEPWNVQKQFCIERTYSEWKLGHFPSTGENCQDCHMDGGHFLNGANTWVAKTIPSLFPNDPINVAALEAGIDRSIANLQEASIVNVSDVSDIDPGNISVFIQNETGHKLITGYPEGRRMWLNVVGYDVIGQVVFESGKYDFGAAVLVPDNQLKVYENKPGIIGEGGCVATFHFVLNNCISKDNRIPPRGFTNAAFAASNAAPVNYPYADAQYWDYTNYRLPPGTASVSVKLYYQSTSREYVEFLRDAPGAGKNGQLLYDAWVTAGKSEPVVMESVDRFIIDTDYDGMANAWETSYGFNPANGADAAGDPDGDGLTNALEYRYNSDPTNTDSDADGLNDGDEYLAGTDLGGSDTDGDLMPDAWEVLAGTDALVRDAEVDDDGDGLNNATEYQIDLLLDGVANADCDPESNNGVRPDTDGDKLPDFYEMAIWGDLAAAPSDDPDGDLLTNLEEYFNGTDPLTDNATLPDADLDLIPDWVETASGANPNLPDALADADGDGIPNIVEYLDGTGINNPDFFDSTDGDYLPDLWETANNVTDQLGDPDGDGVVNLLEFRFGADPNVADVDFDGDGMISPYEVVCLLSDGLADGGVNLDGDQYPAGIEARQYGYEGIAGLCNATTDKDSDGMCDYWEAINGLNPSVPDASQDSDVDGLVNAIEYRNGSDPQVHNGTLADTDVDGLPDYWETIYFGDLVTDNGSGDPDSDGIVTLAEYTGGSNPTLIDLSTMYIEPGLVKLRPGREYQFRLVGYDGDIAWLSSDPNVGDIEPEAGIFKADSQGTTTITAVTLEGDLVTAEAEVLRPASKSSNNSSSGGCTLSSRDGTGDQMLFSLLLVLAPLALAMFRRRSRT